MQCFHNKFGCLLGKKSENVSRMLQEYFSSVENPYEMAFKVAVTCPDFYQGKPVSLSVAGMY